MQFFSSHMRFLTPVLLSLSIIFTHSLQAQYVRGQSLGPQYDATQVSYNDFYENLAPYGQWLDDPKLGFVWRPDVEESFRPYYTNGYWLLTDYGNTWISSYPWGWACFHYGRWTYDSYYGWLWVPGSTWAPGWVSWREGEGVYGWAPLSPGHQPSPKIPEYKCPSDWWVFVPNQYLYTGNYYRYWNGPGNNSSFLKTSTFVNNLYTNSQNNTVVAGPQVRQVERATGKKVQVYKLTTTRSFHSLVHNGTVKLFKPEEMPELPPNGERKTPSNLMSAPKPVRSPMAVNTGYSAPSRFSNEVITEKAVAPGIGYNEVATPPRPAARRQPTAPELRPQQPEGSDPAPPPHPYQAPKVKKK